MMKRTSLIVTAAAALLAGAAVTANTPAQDAEITAQVMSKLATYRGMLARVQVSTQDGVVTLSGNIDTGRSLQLALAAAHETPGVASVRNHLHLIM
jgi:osmotically-inducible protein OsmY